MSTLTVGELNRLRHIVAEQANDAQSQGLGLYLSLGRFDARDVASALEELVALRTQEEDCARRDTEKQEIIESRIVLIDEDAADLKSTVQNLIESVRLLREAVES